MFKSKTRPKLLWIPKVLSLLYIATLTWLSLDTFREDIPFFHQTLQFILQMAPVLILAGLLTISWKHPKLGGAIFTITSLIVTIYFNTFKDISRFLAISFPLCLIGFLFLVFGIMDERVY